VRGPFLAVAHMPRGEARIRPGAGMTGTAPSRIIDTMQPVGSSGSGTFAQEIPGRQYVRRHGLDRVADERHSRASVATSEMAGGGRVPERASARSFTSVTMRAEGSQEPGGFTT
jgi:hypothetical protein